MRAVSRSQHRMGAARTRRSELVATRIDPRAHGPPPARSAAACYLPSVSSARINLADPDFEPDDEQLQGLSARAFAGLGEAQDRRDERLRSAIAAALELVRASLAGADGAASASVAETAPCVVAGPSTDEP